MAMARTAPNRLPIALTMGEPAGIGVEIAIKAWFRRAMHDLSPFYLIADPDHVRATVRRLTALDTRLRSTPVLAEIKSPSEAVDCFDQALPIYPQPLKCKVQPGKLNKANASSVLKSIEQAVAHVRSGLALALVTNPIQKSVLYDAGFAHPGHTEFLAELCGGEHIPVMMLSCPDLKAVPVTIHMPLRDAMACLTTEMIVERALITATALSQDLGYEPPRLAVAGLNPHAGEGGDLGTTENTIIQPAIDELRARGINVIGPLSADSMFRTAARRTYDAAICMYHDQALIPVKVLGFEYGVNTTLGLPIVRTSPDHGTALDIADQGCANAQSLISALAYAGFMARHRAKTADEA